MTSTRILTASLLFSLGTACGGEDDPTIVDVAADNGSFSTLVDALQTTGLDETLAGEGPFTVFAPTDEAFARLPAGVLDSLDAATLSKILTYHVTAGEVLAADVVGLSSATTVEGSELGIRVFDGTVVLDGTVQVTATDIAAGNGVIHAIDSVLLPPDIAFPGDLVAAVQAYPIFDTLVAAVGTADLVSALQSDNEGSGFTVFAPTNVAFDNLGIDIAGLSSADLANVLLYHVVGATVDAAAVVGLDSATTLQGGDIAIAVEGGGVVLNGETNVIQTDRRASNGIVHVIDSVLLPE